MISSTTMRVTRSTDTVEECGASLHCSVRADLHSSHPKLHPHPKTMTSSIHVLSVLHSAYVYVHVCTSVNTICLLSCCVNNLTPHDGSNLVLNHTTMAAGVLFHQPCFFSAWLSFSPSLWGNSGPSSNSSIFYHNWCIRGSFCKNTHVTSPLKDTRTHTHTDTRAAPRIQMQKPYQHE